MKGSYFFLLFLFWNINSLSAEEVEILTMPAAERMAPPRYPNASLFKGEEGYVYFNFMVDTNGEVFEPVVLESMGSESFQRAALKALNNTTFKPAYLNGEPVVGSGVYLYTFSLGEMAGGATKEFIRKYREFSDNLAEGEQKVLQALLNELIESDSRNHYENAFLNWAEYRYEARFGSSLAQMNYLRKALRLEERGEGSYLPENILEFAYQELFRLQVKNNRLGEAVKTYELLVEKGNQESIENNKEAFNEIVSYKNNDKEYGVTGLLGDYGSWGMQLYKQNFYLDQIEGKVDEIKFRCSKKYFSIVLDPELDYAIPESWGDCSMQILGKPNTSFVLVQY